MRFVTYQEYLSFVYFVHSSAMMTIICDLSVMKLPVLQYPGLEPLLDDLLPKKSPLIVAKWSVYSLLSGGIEMHADS